MRLLQVLACSDSPEGYQKLTENLKEAYGEPIIQKRTGVIAPEEGAWEKLKRLSGGTSSN